MCTGWGARRGWARAAKPIRLWPMGRGRCRPRLKNSPTYSLSRPRYRDLPRVRNPIGGWTADLSNRWGGRNPPAAHHLHRLWKRDMPRHPLRQRPRPRLLHAQFMAGFRRGGDGRREHGASIFGGGRISLDGRHMRGICRQQRRMIVPLRQDTNFLILRAQYPSNDGLSASVPRSA